MPGKRTVPKMSERDAVAVGGLAYLIVKLLDKAGG